MSANFSRIAAACSSKLTARGWTFSRANVRTAFLEESEGMVLTRDTKSTKTGRVMTRDTDSARIAERKEVRFSVRIVGVEEVV